MDYFLYNLFGQTFVINTVVIADYKQKYRTIYLHCLSYDFAYSIILH